MNAADVLSTIRRIVQREVFSRSATPIAPGVRGAQDAWPDGFAARDAAPWGTPALNPRQAAPPPSVCPSAGLFQPLRDDAEARTTAADIDAWFAPRQTEPCVPVDALDKVLPKDRSRALHLVAKACVALEGGKIPRDPAAALAAELAALLPRRTVRGVRLDSDAVRAFVEANAAALQPFQNTARAARTRTDVALLRRAMAQWPMLSIEELRRRLVRAQPHLTRAYMQEHLAHRLAPHATRVVDRMGDEPNLLLAASLARAMWAAPRGASEALLMHAHSHARPQFGLVGSRVQPGTTHLAALQDAYPFLPRWPGGVKADDAPAPADVHERLEALARVECEASLFQRAMVRTMEPPLFAERSFLSIDHPLADKLALYAHFISHEGARGRDIHMVWKHYPADPLVVELMQRCLGVRGPVAANEEELAALLRAAAMQALGAGTTGPLFFHVGISDWGWLVELAKAHPEVAMCVAAHTTADVVEARHQDLAPLAAVFMADARVKTIYERYVMFGPSFAAMLGTLEVDQPSLRVSPFERTVVVHGGLGRTIGAAYLDATLALQARARAAGIDVPFPRVIVVDPAAADPAQVARVAELKAHGVEVVASTRPPADIAGAPLLLVNCTAFDVWTGDDFRAAGCSDVAAMNLGSGKRGFHAAWLRANALRVEEPEQTGRGAVTYVLDDGRGGEVRVAALADSDPYNLSVPTPNPQSLSAFIGFLILETLRQGKHNYAQGLLGGQPLLSLQVIFTADDPPRPMLVLLDRDTPADVHWKPEWQPVEPYEYGLEPGAAVGVLSARSSDPAHRERVLRLLAWEQRKRQR